MMVHGVSRRTAARFVALATAAVLVGGVVLSSGLDLGDPTPKSLRVQIAGGRVSANGISFRVPPGWTVKRGSGDYCGQSDRTVLIGENLTHGTCEWREVIEVDHWNAETFVPPVQRPGSPLLREMTLPGGQPVWIFDPFGARLASQPPPEVTTFTAYVPWASVRLEFSLRGPSLVSVLGSVRSSGKTSSRLRIAHRIDAMMNGDTPVTDHGVEVALVLLGKPPKEIDAHEAPCADATFYGGWRSIGEGGATLISFFSHGRRVGSLVISSNYHGCRAYTSSRGGRVHIPDDAKWLKYGDAFETGVYRTA
jgi:hypothetical protein